ncbi:MAG: indolepyruvate ferredoxin oxidoreductase family protein [Alphaproteobacteria bacterium]|nr:indolepyruvate ferredoxin oxidoreductase family protein [Alphaproteobacteria bacterium]
MRGRWRRRRWGDDAVLAQVTLDDKYRLERGRVYLSGIQALVRLPLLQRARDRAAGLDTGGFISGYRGSPLGIYDRALAGAQDLLRANRIHFEPGLNEDLAATAIWGSQQLNLFEGATVDGVFGIWYGKGPGVDRCGDVFKHANGAGTARHGGVLAVMGDDHGSHSSTMPHQSELILVAAMMPILAPGSVQDYLDLGLAGFALSRFSGCWVGLKAVAQTVETSSSVDIDPARPTIVLPDDFAMPAGGLNIRRPDPSLEQERRLHGPRMDAVLAFARANRLDRVTMGAGPARLGIAAAGKAYLDVREALAELGIDERRAEQLGIRLYKIAMCWPLEPQGVLDFARGLDEIVVVEEKRGLIEDQIARILYNAPADTRPRLVGKRDERGAVLFPSNGEIGPTLVARVIGRRLLARPERLPEIEQRLARVEALEQRVAGIAPLLTRPPFFCSGCPHNTSTRLPEGSRGMAGIGCHGMIAFMPERRTPLWSHMGGEGMAWVGQAPFTKEKHVFQNLGDGTYSHSGLLAIRGAAASGVNITYKILYNDAVAMTGGQAVEGQLEVPQITRQVAAEGARRIVVVSDEPDKYGPGADFASGVEFRHRDELDAVQRELRDTPGLTILIYDQTCAAEKRRRRKRGTMPDPDRRVFINAAVCEGCGDCSRKSNCISVQPLETPLGRKRRIDQSACNKDFSCLAGFCPSFVTVSGARPRRQAGAPAASPTADLAAGLPLPTLPAASTWSIVVTGVGGTGVITVGALLGMAAHLEGKRCTVLDSTGMSQKNGAVMSHVRISASDTREHAARIPAGAADLLLACDIVVATGAAALGTVEAGRTRAVVNSTLVPPAAFILDRDMNFREAEMRAQIEQAAGPDRAVFLPATQLATALIGDAIASNVFMLGFAFQRGLLPVGLAALERAIELNGAAVRENRAAFAAGRRAAHDPAFVDATLGVAAAPGGAPRDLDSIVAHRAELLLSYQDAAYADRYRAVVDAARVAEERAVPGARAFAEAVARNLARLMAYKDEYEVARLYVDGAFARALAEQFEGDARPTFHLAPPFLARPDPNTGEPAKLRFGPWMLHVFRVLARLKHLRGTRWDVFGRSEERRMERGLIAAYEQLVAELAGGLRRDNHALAVEIADLPDAIRGFGHVKRAAVAAAKEKEARLLERFRAPQPLGAAAE